MTKITAAELAAKTDNAYSFDRYSSWTACAALLLARGFSEQEAEAILRSKHMRWAGDSSSAKYGRVTSKDLGRYLDHHNAREVKHCRFSQQLLPGTRAMRQLVAETFATSDH